MPDSTRQLRGSIGAHESWARTPDRSARTQPARDAFNARFERQADPDGRLLPEERARRAEHLRKAYYARLALAGLQARKSKAPKTSTR